jgi:hypothetical protein
MDIVITMASPFSPHDRRMKFYILGSLIGAAIISSTTPGRKLFNEMENDTFKSGDSTTIMWKSGMAVVFLSIYILYATFSVAFAYRLNTRPGFSSGLRV